MLWGRSPRELSRDRQRNRADAQQPHSGKAEPRSERQLGNCGTARSRGAAGLTLTPLRAADGAFLKLKPKPRDDAGRALSVLLAARPVPGAHENFAAPPPTDSLWGPSGSSCSPFQVCRTSTEHTWFLTVTLVVLTLQLTFPLLWLRVHALLRQDWTGPHQWRRWRRSCSPSPTPSGGRALRLRKLTLPRGQGPYRLQPAPTSPPGIEGAEPPGASLTTPGSLALEQIRPF